jgi:hypothetical protein
VVTVPCDLLTVDFDIEPKDELNFEYTELVLKIFLYQELIPGTEPTMIATKFSVKLVTHSCAPGHRGSVAFAR